jgi:tetratricopeptide (TPR) repeat protein
MKIKKLKKTLFLVVVMLCLVFAQNTEDLVNSGIELVNNGDFTGAETLFNQALGIDPEFTPAIMQLAQLHLRKGDMNETQRYLRLAIDMDPGSEEFRTEYNRINEINTLMAEGSRAMNNGSYEDAFYAYKNVYDNFPYFSEAVYSLGLVKFREKDFEGAAGWFNKTLEINPDHENAKAAIANVARNTFNDGNIAYRRGDLDGALASYRKVLVIDNSFYQALYQIGVIETRLGNISKAVAAYNRSLEINPDFYRGWYALGLALNKNNETENALSAFEKSIELNPGYTKAYGSIGEIYYNNKESDKAIDILKAAVQVDGTYAKAYLMLGIIFIEQENYEEAINNLELATSVENDNPNSWYRLAHVFNLMNDCESARSAARESIDIKENSGAAWFELGLAESCNGSGNKTAALNAFERARNDRKWRSSAEYEIDRIRNPEKYQQ